MASDQQSRLAGAWPVGVPVLAVLAVLVLAGARDTVFAAVMICLVLPTFISSAKGPEFSPAQLAFAAVASLVIHADHPGDRPRDGLARRSAPARPRTCPDRAAGADGGGEHPDRRPGPGHPAPGGRAPGAAGGVLFLSVNP